MLYSRWNWFYVLDIYYILWWVWKQKITNMLTKDEYMALFGPFDWDNIPEDAKVLGDDGEWYIIPELVS